MVSLFYAKKVIITPCATVLLLVYTLLSMQAEAATYIVDSNGSADFQTIQNGTLRAPFGIPVGSNGSQDASMKRGATIRRCLNSV